MKPECVQKVQEHLSKVRGKPVKLSETDIANIDKRMNQAARDLRQLDPAKWKGLAPEDRIAAMGIEAARQLQKAADNRAIAKLAQIDARIRALDDIKAMAATPVKEGGTLSKSGRYQYPHVAAVVKMLQQADRQKAGAVAAVHGQLSELINAMHVKFVRFPSMESQEGEKIVGLAFREMMGEATNVPEAKAYAAQLSSLFKGHVDRLNDFGANINELKNFVPQDNNARLINQAGKETYTGDLINWIDKSDFLDEKGAQLPDDEIRNVLGTMFDSITTDGRNKQEFNPDLAQIEGRLGGRSVMERSSSFSRKITFKDAASHEAYHAKYSELTPTGLLIQHLTRTAEDIALVERFGPDAKQNIMKLTDVAHKLDDEHAEAYRARTGKVVSKERNERTIAGLTPEQLSEALVGRDTDFSSVWVDASRWLSSMNSATKLTRTTLRAVPQDAWTVTRYAGELGQLSRLPQIIGAAADGATRRDLQVMGIGTQIIQQSAERVGRNSVTMAQNSRMNTRVAKAVGGEAMNRISAGVARLTALSQWTNGTGRVGQLIHGVHLMDNVGKDWAGLSPASKQIFGEVGINETNWDVVRQIPAIDLGKGVKIPDMRKGVNISLHADPAKHNEGMRLIQAFLSDGHNKITNERDLLARNAGMFGAQPGTTVNAVIQQLMTFKGVVNVIAANKIRMYRRHEGWGLGGVIAADMIGATLAGLVGNTVVNAFDGKKTDWANPSQIFKGFTTGGGAAFFGDLISFGVDQMNPSGSGSSTAGAIPGPSGSDVIDLFGIVRAAIKSDGDWGKTQYKALQFTRNHIPLMNLWYTKSAFDHLFMNHMNEELNPGYQNKLKDMNEEAGQEYFLPPTRNAF